MDRQVHHEAVQRALSLGRGTDPAALAELIPLLRFPSPEVCRLAASAIGKLAAFGADPALAVPALLPVALRDRRAQTQQYWGMDTADYKIGMLKKQQLYQQEGKRLISIHPPDKARLDAVLRHKLAFFGYTIPPNAPPGIGER